jgi:hypothetical protein
MFLSALISSFFLSYKFNNRADLIMIKRKQVSYLSNIKIIKLKWFFDIISDS